MVYWQFNFKNIGKNAKQEVDKKVLQFSFLVFNEIYS